MLRIRFNGLVGKLPIKFVTIFDGGKNNKPKPKKKAKPASPSGGSSTIFLLPPGIANQMFGGQPPHPGHPDDPEEEGRRFGNGIKRALDPDSDEEWKRAHDELYPDG